MPQHEKTQRRKITRRAFLVGSAALAGGVAFGTYQVKKPHENPLLANLPDGAAAFNPWVQISSEGITLITPHTDLGQGAYALQAQLIAEELDVEPGQYETSPGQPAAVYYNTALGDESAPFNSHDNGLAAETMRGVMGTFFKLLGGQVTGGSSTVPDSFEKLRLAGAVARETLKSAAAQKSGYPVEQLKTANASVILPDNSSIPYTQLAALAATIPAVTDVTLRDPAQWRRLGRATQRSDVLQKSTGTLPYTIDLEVEGMLHAAVRTNPRQGGEMWNFNGETALGMRGVVDVLRLSNGIAVLADNTWRAFKAAETVHCNWGPAPYPKEMDEHWAEVSASFSEKRLDKEWRHDGDVEAPIPGGTTHRAEYRTPYVAHQPLEPLSVIALATETGAEIWTSHQMPRFLQDKVAAIVGCDSEDVALHQQYGGGSFGHRLELDHVTLCAEIAVQKKGTPIKLTYSREEDFAHDYPRQIGMGRGVGIVKDGQVQSYDLQAATVSSSTSQMARLGQSLPGPDMQIAAGAWNLPYAIPNFRMRAYRVPELAPTSSWRSVGASTGGFYADCFLDELIHEAGADPMEERLRLMNRKESRQVLEAVAEMCNWGVPLQPGTGRGVAFVDSFGVPVAEVVEVTNTEDGIRLDKVWVAADVGRVLDPVHFDSMMKGGVIWGLGHAMNCEITYSDGVAEQANFWDHEAMRMAQCPEIETRGLELASKIRGIGEPPVPPAAPALANAIFAATGQRLREMPFNKFVSFV